MKIFYDCEFLEGKQRKRRTFLEALTAVKIYTEPTIDLISIGMVAEDGREYYAISKDFNLNEAWNRYDLKEDYAGQGTKVYWIRENVLKPIFWDLLKISDPHWVNTTYGNYNNFSGDSYSNDFKTFKILLHRYGKSNKQIAEEVKVFCSSEQRVWIENKDQYIEKTGITEFTTSADLLGVFCMFKVGNPIFYGHYSAYDHVALCWLFGKMMDLPDGFPMYTIDLQQMLYQKPVEYEVVLTKFSDGKYVGGCDPYFNSWEEHVDYPKQENEHNALDDARWNLKLYKFIETLDKK